ncbi:MAG: DUF6029 family protein [Candidatus Neomarinimicrobiota bacterium]|nr:DUF6029 family protein [Candidatus Neomarinimicrobiota bacterium]
MKIYLLFLIQVYLFANTNCCEENLDFTFSLESKFGKGLSIKNSGTSEEDYNYFENLLDINIKFNPQLSIWSQLEYSNPPVFGLNQDGLNKFYIEFTNENINLKIGNLYTLYGNGLGLNMFMDQNVDIDNSVKGLELNYYYKNNTRFFSILGKDNYLYRSNPAMIITDRSLINTIYSIGVEQNFDLLGNIQTYFLNQTSEINQDVLILYNNEHLDTRIGNEFYNRVSFEDFKDDTLSSLIKNLSWYKAIGPFDILSEFSHNTYSKLLGEKISGYKLYSSISTYFNNLGITYEYKDYNEPYFIQSISSAPTVNRESTSILASRYSHSINFGDEIGHQLEMQYLFNDNQSFIFNISQSNSHIGKFKLIQIDTSLNLNIISKHYSHSNPLSILFFNKNDEDIAFKPYRQLYSEINGYSFSNKLYYQFGIEKMDEIYKYYETKLFEREYIDLDSYLDSVNNKIEEFDNYINAELNSLEENYNLNFSQATMDFNSIISYCENFGICGNVDPLNYIDSINTILNDSLYILENQFLDDYEQMESELMLEKLDYKADLLSSKEYNYEKQSIITLPFRFSWNFGNGSSLSAYLEHQWRDVIMNHDVYLLDGTIDSRSTNKEEYYYQYVSLSYRSSFKWSFTYFYDSESHKKRMNDIIWSNKIYTWKGVDISIDINSYSQLSIFLGSQKGGRVCANGICADQPGFKDGFKLTYRTFF